MIEVKIPETYQEFIENNKNNFEKRKYFKINSDLTVEIKEPSYLIELSYIYYKYMENNNVNLDKINKIKEAIDFESINIYKSKDKKIERLSKIELESLEDQFWRTLVNQDKVHTLKLGNELVNRNPVLFFEIMYRYSIISKDINKLIKVYLCEIIYNDKGYSFEIIKNMINYFVKSSNIYINYNSIEDVSRFASEQLNSLYIFIYNNVYYRFINSNIINEKVKLQLMKLDLHANIEMTKSQELILEYLKNKKIMEEYEC